MSVVAYFERFPLFRDYVLPLIASPTRRRLASGAFWGGVGGVVSRGAVLVTSFFLARILGQAQFGEYGVVNSTSAMLSAVAGLGVGTTATKYVAQLRNTDKGRAGRIISLSSMVTWISGTLYGLVFVVLASWLADKTLAAPHLSQVLRISSISVALGVINGAQQCSLSGFEAFRMTALVNIIGGLFQSVAVCLGAWHGGVKGAIMGMAASTLVIVVMTRCALRAEMQRSGIQNWWTAAWREWRVLVSFSLPSFLTTLIAGPVFWVCNAVLANQPNGYAELGVFNAANQWYAAVSFLPGLLMTAMLPILSEKYETESGKNNVEITQKMMRMICVIVIPFIICISLVAPYIMRGYGASFVSGHRVLILCVVTAGIHAIITPSWIAIIATGRMWICFLMNLGCSVILLVGMFVLNEYGAVGFATARLISYIAHGCWLTWYFTRYCGLPVSNERLYV